MIGGKEPESFVPNGCRPSRGAARGKTAVRWGEEVQLRLCQRRVSAGDERGSAPCAENHIALAQFAEQCLAALDHGIGFRVPQLVGYRHKRIET